MRRGRGWSRWEEDGVAEEEKGKGREKEGGATASREISKRFILELRTLRYGIN
jgi:hypothetical protein